ncbi:chemotaxis protein CheD [Salinihabitans flavidus]|uniref:Chemotaxis protein CheD n=2 Tax=Salinihabitans flavidus TaxID=569882 RepID=A0A1H8NVA8_9RHOB|nr:chemotaxis protein CheD [Salinihabitans flavidus]
MNHFLLPGSPEDRDTGLQYGVNAMEILINALMRAGARKERMQAKIFGGARMFTSRANIGEKNAEFATWFLKSEGIECIGGSIGGEQGRKLRYVPVTGQARQMFLEQSRLNVVEDPLSATFETPRRRRTDPGQVDLF